MKRQKLPAGPATCAYCGGHFLRETFKGGHFRIYCSRRCRNNSAWGRSRMAKGPSSVVHARTCGACRKEFRTSAHNHKYCCVRCRHVAHEANYRARRTCVYLSLAMQIDVRVIADKKGRTVNWLFNRAWRLARKRIQRLSSQ